MLPNGGNEPTLTDANLVLGRIPPALIGGGIPLDTERARGGLRALAAGYRASSPPSSSPPVLSRSPTGTTATPSGK